MNLTRLTKNPSIAGAKADIQQSEPASPSSILGDYVICVDESGDACPDPIDPRSPIPDPRFPIPDSRFAMLNIVFCIIRKDRYFDHVVSNLKALKEEFFSHTHLILNESEMRRKTGVFARLRDQSDHQRWMTELLA